ncbi:MAG: Asp23/Gls24 family envelope stress response protein [Firmicutes bacterium]|nr:Asp23/Gls24 family envelope stress response protein [Bacillota bacterium]
MFTTIKSELGLVTIEQEVLAKIAGLAAMDCYGIVGMAAKSVKDGLVYLLKKERLTKGVRLQMDDNILKINLHIIVEYGTNINAIAETLKSNVKYKVEEQSGITVGQVNIFIEGVRIK